MTELEKRKRDVLTKFYGGLRRDYYHKFSIEDGICENCQVFIGDAHTRICSVVTDDEVALFRPISITTRKPLTQEGFRLWRRLHAIPKPDKPERWERPL